MTICIWLPRVRHRAGAVAREPLEPQLRGALAHGRLGAAEPISELDQAPAAVLVVERVGEANGRVLGRCPAAHRERGSPLPVGLSRRTTIATWTEETASGSEPRNGAGSGVR